QGQSVAVLDSGVTTNHPAFTGVDLESQVFLTTGETDACFGDDVTSVQDMDGHGTHVAGIVASQGSSSWTGYQGVAKGVQTLYNVKIAFVEKQSCWTHPGFPEALAYDGDTLAGIDWVVQNTAATILNFSY